MNRTALEIFYEHVLLLSIGMKTKELGDAIVVNREKLKEAYNEALDIQNGWKLVSDFEPMTEQELLVKSPQGIVHMAHWRPAYSIFTCQDKSENTDGWKWKLI